MLHETMSYDVQYKLLETIAEILNTEDTDIIYYVCTAPGLDVEPIMICSDIHYDLNEALEHLESEAKADKLDKIL